ncbi:MAG: CDP-diacylglycerol--serine O-phosphatidyltransferase [Proteiniphilum sp.]|uniref:CDP-diacylglycerol--serine O-phosphatidyltransferase n=1 Tax=Proteiniphilum sp. TaxID=1926877 RepID=UPI002ABBB5B8|nr:CDP-diacylglycerol--serine O-phosphatidyltransferase [Proteiniphilum sp.]MDY9917328.1 CDP-diacylglycerol--serine O-phosphatidyltransferase [Proteiniphilum sp.]
MRKQIPNILTLSNLFSGCIAVVMAFQANFKAVVIWVAVAALFDFLDGMAARLLKAYSPLGKELDSLADVISFGVAPAAAVFILLRDYFLLPGYLEPLHVWIPYLAFLIPVFSAYRLAKFNIDDRQATSFRGLPAPANGLFWVSYSYGIEKVTSLSSPLAMYDEYFSYLTLILIVLMSLLMVSEIPMFSLKTKNLSFKGNERQIILVILTILLVALLGISGVAWGIVAYIILSVLGRGGNTKQTTSLR